MEYLPASRESRGTSCYNSVLHEIYQQQAVEERLYDYNKTCCSEFGALTETQQKKL